MSKKPIIVLSEQLANMIAAGEVVERPASVVKELVENSIDAGATTIKIELQDSGLKYIKVVDNGSGMEKEEIPVALMRHATSKIVNQHDLFSIMSLGFRGEALPSIASVAKMRITSATLNQVGGYFYEYLNSNIVDEGQVAFPQGTKIEVSDLFYNTPARYKHLSNLSTELSHIMNYLNRVAIGYPDIAISVFNNDKNVFQTHGDENLASIIAATYGNDVAKNMLDFHGANNLYEIKGFTSKNSVFRSNKNSINILVNKRVIRNQQLIYAITDAYKSILPVGKYPITILEIITDPALIDVNVHPSKLEIRFTDEFALRALITTTISKALHETKLIYETSEEIDNKFSSYETPKPVNETSTFKPNNKETIDDIWNHFSEVETTKHDDEDSDDIIEQESVNDISLIKEEQNQENLYTPVKESFEQINSPLDKVDTFFQSLHYIGQYNKTYLLMESENNLYLIDQHAAMERAKYEQITKYLQNSEHEQYTLLVPFHFDFNSSEINLILDNTETLKKLGIEIEEFGNTTIIVRTSPTWIPKDSENEFIYDIINYVITNRLVNKSTMYDELAKMMSCKRSIKAHMAITDLEVSYLLKQLDACQMPFTCPHGRPTLIKFTLSEIEKLFKRRM